MDEQTFIFWYIPPVTNCGGGLSILLTTIVSYSDCLLLRLMSGRVKEEERKINSEIIVVIFYIRWYFWKGS